MPKRLPIIAAAITVLGATGVVALNAPSVARVQDALQEAATPEQTVTFTIKNMTCSLCPVTIKKAMRGVAGVRSVDINFAAKTATVVFDPSMASAAAIAAASANAGYPAKPTR